MDLNEYHDKAIRTLAPTTFEQMERLQTVATMLHAVLGLQDEIGEIAKAIKGYVYYNKPLDQANMMEEGGDLLWYWNLLASSIGVRPSAIAVANIEKLSKRYPKGFFDEKDARENRPEYEPEPGFDPARHD